MLGWLKKRSQEGDSSRMQNKHIVKATAWIRARQQRLAGRLNRWYGALTSKEQLTLWLLFFCGMFGLSGWMFYAGIRGSYTSAPTFLHQPTITQPLPTELPDSLDVHWLEEKRARWMERQRQVDSISKTK